MNDNSLRIKAFSGIVWSSVLRFGSMSITLASNIILARLLIPSDFGCIGMLMIFISLSNTFIDGGFGSALIQKKMPTLIDYTTIFYWNIFLSICLYLILFLCSPYISSFYKLPLLKDVLRVLGIVLIINAFSIVQQNILRKQLLFKKLSIVILSSSFISLLITIFAAYHGLGVWSLVIQQISFSFFNAIFITSIAFLYSCFCL